MRKIIAALQPGYLPWIGFFDLIKRSDLFIIEDNLKYTKQDWRNRNRIRSANGFTYLTVPVCKGSDHLPINQVLIDQTQQWQKRHFNLLYENYHRAPFWGKYEPFLKESYSRKWALLVDLDMHFINFLKTEFELQTEIILLSRLPIKFDQDKTGSLIRLVKEVGGTVFLEGASGRKFIEVERFHAAGLEIWFQDYQCKPYPQQYEPFMSHLSAIDLLLNVGPAGKELI